MYQVVREMRDGMMRGHIYSDGWPNFSTIITQEFSPRLSEVSKICIQK